VAFSPACRWALMAVSRSREEIEPLTPEEAETLEAILEGIHSPSLRTLELVRLNLRRLIMLMGPPRFLPTTLGCAWWIPAPTSSSSDKPRPQDGAIVKLG